MNILNKINKLNISGVKFFKNSMALKMLCYELALHLQTLIQSLLEEEAGPLAGYTFVDLDPPPRQIFRVN